MIIKTLAEIFEDLPFDVIPAASNVASVTGIAIDSRAVKPGDLFVAMQGGSVDGHDYILKAIENGAAAVVGQRKLSNTPVPYFQVENSRRSLTYLAASFYDWPGRKLTMIGVTGTDGKTTTCNLIYHILVAAGIKTGMISTVNAVIGDALLDTGFHVTTPDAHDVQRYLAQMVEAGMTHAVLETTSHGWSQHRVDSCEFDVGVITNITHEHLDEHGSYENYRSAKARLFSNLERTDSKPQGNPRLAVFNRDDQSFDFLNEFVKVNKVSYGLDTGSDIHAGDIRYGPHGMEFTAAGKIFRINVKVNLVGRYNVSNCLAALGATVLGLGIHPETAAKGIGNLSGIPGRMEVINMGQDFISIVDFAHTPNALKVTLETAKEMISAESVNNDAADQPRIIVIFGSAGLRDKEKRRMMAEIASGLADLTVLTAEDPRTESLDGILEEMAAGARSRGGREGETFWRVPDRGEAIRFALRLARPGDIVLSCGKGHEQSMCFGKIEYPWDDRIAIRAALSGYLGLQGPKMPYLPTQDKSEKEWLKT